MTVHEDVRDVIHRHARAIDDGRPDVIRSLYVDDAVFITPDKRVHGADSIAEVLHLPPERRGKHLCVNTTLDTNAGEVLAVTDFVFLGPDKTVRSAGRYFDRLRESAGVWLFVEHRMERM